MKIVRILAAYIVLSMLHNRSYLAAREVDDASGLAKGALTDMWVRMTESEALSYYTPYEICRFSRRTLCETQPGFEISVPDCHACGPGVAGHPEYCSDDNGYLLRPRSISPDSATFVDVMWRLLQRGTNTLVLVGDSLTFQYLSDSICSSIRSGFDVILDNNDITKESAGFLLPKKLRSNKEEYAAFSARFPRGAIPADPDSPFFTIFLVQLLTAAHSPGVLAATKAISEDPRFGPLLGTRGGGIPAGPLLFVVNMGQHLHEAELYDSHMKTLVTQLLHPLVAAGHDVLFRETGAQHFPSSTGGYDQYDKSIGSIDAAAWSSPVSSRAERIFKGSFPYTQISANNVSGISAGNTKAADTKKQATAHEFPNLHYKCVPIEDPEHLQNWRNPIANKYINDFNSDIVPQLQLAYHQQQQTEQPVSLATFKPREVSIIPWWNITAARYDFHTAKMGDCTHYCNGPMIFSTVQTFIADYLSHQIE